MNHKNKVRHMKPKLIPDIPVLEESYIQGQGMETAPKYF